MRWRAQSFFGNEVAASDALYKNNFVSDLLGNQYLFEILQTSLTFKNSENAVKSECFEKRLRWRASFSFRHEGWI